MMFRYSPLPNPQDVPTTKSTFISAVLSRILLLFRRWTLLLFFLGSFVLTWFILVEILIPSTIPNYQDIRIYEHNLPQHRFTAEGRYLRVEGQLHGHGLNNVLEELILMTHLAYTVNRSFVFEDFIWSDMPLPFVVDDFGLRPSRIPLNAFISGPAAGGPMPDDTARATVCPLAQRNHISSLDAPKAIEGTLLLDWWVRRLEALESERCIVVDAVEQLLSLFVWSPLVNSALIRNFAILEPPEVVQAKSVAQSELYSGLIAVHIRRGDYSRHCRRLLGWGSKYIAFNQFPGLLDKFDPEEYLLLDKDKARIKLLEPYYLEHCLPEIPQIVARLHGLREAHPTLKRIFVLSNARPWWLRELGEELARDGWQNVKNSLDLVLDKEQKNVGMSVDMAIATSAEIFVGNGFSSLTANVVLLRKAKGFADETNRFF
ncbi:hypothetical protein C8J56DRAFT_1093143 [Mycena floridula]|nr:hypothetical protein C8J56DRAFT_1093143 [Mycena floridula]